MATYSVSQSKTYALTNGQVDTITFTGTGTTLRIQTDKHHTAVSFTVGQPYSDPATPTALGDDCYTLLSGHNLFDIKWSGNGCVVKIIATGTPTVSVALIG